MIRVTVELVPGGNENKKSLISQVEIRNDGLVDKDFPLYFRYVYKGWSSMKGMRGLVNLHGVIFHNQNNNVYHLVKLVAEQVMLVLK